MLDAGFERFPFDESHREEGLALGLIDLDPRPLALGEHNRFARNVSEWLERKTSDCEIEHLTLFAPPRFLGVLRQTWSPQLAARITEHESDLGYMTAGDLARHQSIVKVLESSNGKRGA